ncbi:TonB-dependent receptor-like protein [Flavobacterium sp. 1]|uniref:TonB-dependent receptor n=1 Tax=Flavobacterium sp. 1 TaxID=2035200 RepID=UPI000C23C863|nr:TonB-dependent receptor plug domain-containing protein [Flavobacterium sp. 1]PJJ07971.1 TonB-dependent receptor-like protein [Flavobacterium sp. 1]
MRNLKIITFLLIAISTTQIKAQTEDLEATAIQAKHLYTQLCAKEKNPLYVVNGIVFNNSVSSLADIKPEDIEKIDVLKDVAAKEKYGDKGTDGVIVITLRKSAKNRYKKLLKDIAKDSAEDINHYDLIISGVISDIENKHISNVIISNLTKREAYYSDSLGSYKINVGKNDFINFSKKGFRSLTVKATHQTIPNIVLKKRTLNEIIIEKPVIYLYPTKKTDITFSLDFNGKLLTTFPKYESNWEVTAYPDGRIFEKKTKRFYNSLFWDGNQKFSDNHYQYKSGFVVSKNDLTVFLIEKLEIMGLNNLEINEFVQYWLPVLEKNETNFIHFYVNSDYDVISKNIVFPKPDTSIRIFMDFYGLDEKIKIQEQKLVKQERKGFTLVEWGGSDVTAPVNELKSLKL